MPIVRDTLCHAYVTVGNVLIWHEQRILPSLMVIHWNCRLLCLGLALSLARDKLLRQKMVNRTAKFAHPVSSVADLHSLLHGMAGSGGPSRYWVPHVCPPTKGYR